MGIASQEKRDFAIRRVRRDGSSNKKAISLSGREFIGMGAAIKNQSGNDTLADIE